MLPVQHLFYISDYDEYDGKSKLESRASYFDEVHYDNTGLQVRPL